MAVKALIAFALLVAIIVGISLPVPHGANSAEAQAPSRESTIPTMDVSRG
jgi:hypothetical protein